MSRERNARRGYATLAMCTALGLGLVASPATAGKGGKATSSTETETAETTSVTLTSDAYYRESGTSDPTNVPIVLSDLDKAAATLQPEDQTFATAVWGKVTGRGVVVAVMDGGFNLRHPDLAGRLAETSYDGISGQEHELDCDAPDGELYDDDMYEYDPLVKMTALSDDMFFANVIGVSDYGNGADDDGDGLVDEGLGHGTFVAGMVLRMAPEATILPIRVRDDEGYGLDTWIERGLRYAIDQRVDVINMSIESADMWSWEMTALFVEAKRAGIVVVLSAGNDGNAKISDMVWEADSLVVGAVDRTDRIADFSSYKDLWHWDGGPRMVFAPGVDLSGPFGFPSDDADAVWSGTSFSAPLVSGAVALLREFSPWLSPDEINDRIASTADTVFDARGKKLRYSGRVNVLNAVAR